MNSTKILREEKSPNIIKNFSKNINIGNTSQIIFIDLQNFFTNLKIVGYKIKKGKLQADFFPHKHGYKILKPNISKLISTLYKN